MEQNPNTPRLWDKLLFEKNNELLKSPYYRDKLDKVYKFLEHQRGKILDIGFGMGNLEKKIVEKNLVLEIYGVDFSSKAVKRAKEKLKGKFYKAKTQNLPFKNAFFGTTIMLDVLEHIPESESKITLDEINRVTKRNGYFVLSVPLNENLEEMNKEGKNLNAHLRQYTPKLLESELNASGFKVIKKDFIWAFSKNYFLKNLIVRLWPTLRKPNVLVVYCRKIK